MMNKRNFLHATALAASLLALAARYTWVTLGLTPTTSRSGLKAVAFDAAAAIPCEAAEETGAAWAGWMDSPNTTRAAPRMLKILRIVPPND